MTKRVVGYFENWAQYRQAGGKFFPAQINPSLFTHINFAFGLIGFVTWSVDPSPTRTGSQRYTGDYTVQPVEWNDQMVLYPAIQALKQQNGNLKTLLSIGGWSVNSCSDTPNPGNPHPYGPYTCQLFSQMAADPNHRTQFINSAIAYAEKYGFDGIDIDWEYPGYVGRGGGPNDLANFLSLVQEFRAAAGPDFLLTMAAPAIVPTGLPQSYHDDPSTFFSWLQHCSQSLDWLNIMSYDYHGAFDDPVLIGTGVNSPLLQDSTPYGPFSIKQTVETYLGAGISPDQMVLGMPTYGRGYIVSNPGALASNGNYGQPFSGPSPAGPATQVPGVLAYYEITQQLAAGSLTEVWDDATLTPYAFNATSGEWVSYDNPDSVAYKTAYVNAMNLGGAMVWSIDDDDFANGYPLISKITDILNNPADAPQLPGGVIGKRPPPPGVTGPDVLWSTDSQVPTAANAYGITGTPALAELNGTLYLVHRGGGNDPGHLWWATSDGYKWANEQALVTTAGGPVGAYGAPALAAFNNSLYCVHPGGGNDPGHLWWTVFNGTSWTPDQQLTTTVGGPVGTSGAAALAVFNGVLYCIHPGGGGDSNLWYTSFDGSSWAPDQKITTRYGVNLIAPSSPAAAVFEDLLYCVYVDASNGGSTDIASAVFDGQVWDVGPPTGAKINSTESPALVVYQDILWCIHGDGMGFQGYLGGATFDGTEWSADAQIMTGLQHNGVVGTSAAPGLAVFNDRLHCLHPGGGGPSTYMWETTTPPAQLQGGWIEATGDNGYVYLQLDNLVAGQGQNIDTSQTLTVQAGVPYLVASMTTDPEQVDFPSGAMVTVKGPDGTLYNQTIGTDTELVFMVGSSLQLLALSSPPPGDYQITISVPAGVTFFFQASTMPSADQVSSIDGAFDQLAAQATTDRQLARRLGVPDTVSLVAGGLIISLAWRLFAEVGKWAAKNPKLAYSVLAGIYAFLSWIISWGKGRGGKNPKVTPQPNFPDPDPTCNIPEQSDRSSGLVNWFIGIGNRLGQTQTDIDKIINQIANTDCLFVGEIIRNNDITTRQTYISVRDFLAALTNMRNTVTNDNPFVVRITIRPPNGPLVQTPWLRIGRRLYVTGFNHFTWDLTDARWQTLQNENYGTLARENIDSFGMRDAFQNTDAWAANPRGSILGQAWQLIALFCEGARFEIVGLMLAALFDCTRTRRPPRYNPLLVLFQNWETMTDHRFYRVLAGDSWRYTITLLRSLRGMPSLNAAQRYQAEAWWAIQEFHLEIYPNVEGYTGTNSRIPKPQDWANWNAPPQLAVVAADCATAE